MPRRHRSQTQSGAADENAGNDDNLNEIVNKCVRYIIYRSGSNDPIKRNDLKKNVLTNGRIFDRVIEKASHILDAVYGFKLVLCHENANEFYVTAQNIDNYKEVYSNDEEVPADINKVLIMLVLTNIFMSGSPVNEASLFIFLNTMGINVDSDKGIFGKIKDFINVTMVKQNYIVMQTDQLSREVTYKWGARAENTISKHDILKFVSKIYGDKQPTSWVSQYEEANNQFDIDNISQANGNQINNSQ